MARNRQQTSTRIKQAAVRLLEREGFAGWGINAIAREADTDKVLIYRYFNSLDGLLQDIIRTTDYWPGPSQLAQESGVRYVQDTIDFLDSRPIIRQLVSLPRDSGNNQLMEENFSKDLDRWLEGIRSNTSGNISDPDLSRLPAMVYYRLTTGALHLSAADIWEQVSPPLEWREAESESDYFEELPTELL